MSTVDSALQELIPGVQAAALDPACSVKTGVKLQGHDSVAAQGNKKVPELPRSWVWTPMAAFWPGGSKARTRYF